jgi:hypothetical protein
VGDEIEVRPGIVSKDSEGNVRCVPIFSKVSAALTYTHVLTYAGAYVQLSQCDARGAGLLSMCLTWMGVPSSPTSGYVSLR